ncbi:hypothetical protein J4G33_08505 [Actinotalea sp. BY-33]|uniref:Uncharacterized protein n=1 Tax=Actinotalea soli TaxID=2819234 RepID=A0A939RUY6_9CELL|nr:hypothetical protein [Actinotalea soli]
MPSTAAVDNTAQGYVANKATTRCADARARGSHVLAREARQAGRRERC